MTPTSLFLRTLSATAVAALLAGCNNLRPTPPAPAPDPLAQPGGTCNAANAQWTLGKTVDQRLAEEAQRRAGARVVRVLRPGQMATMEFAPARLTLDTDAQGRITTARCG